MGDEAVIMRALGAFGREGATVTPINVGNIHQTYGISVGADEFILQRVNPIFAPGIHENILAVTEHLAAKGLPTLRLVPTEAGQPTADLGPGGVWRLMTRVPGTSYDVCPSPAHARAAGALVAGFHGALDDLDHVFRPLGIVWHEFDAYRGELDAAMAQHRNARLHPDVAALAARIQGLVAGWPNVSRLPTHVVHTDLKFNNLLFDPAADDPPQATSLIDLDTVCRLPLYVELGDAWRSWCNRSGEDDAAAELDLEAFSAAADGYLGQLAFDLTADEHASLALALERMSLELAVRFAADVLNDNYFGWKPERFSSRAEHNLVRAHGQLSLAEQARDTRSEQARALGL